MDRCLFHDLYDFDLWHVSLGYSCEKLIHVSHAMICMLFIVLSD